MQIQIPSTLCFSFKKSPFKLQSSAWSDYAKWMHSLAWSRSGNWIHLPLSLYDVFCTSICQFRPDIRRRFSVSPSLPSPSQVCMNLKPRRKFLYSELQALTQQQLLSSHSAQRSALVQALEELRNEGVGKLDAELGEILFRGRLKRNIQKHSL